MDFQSFNQMDDTINLQIWAEIMSVVSRAKIQPRDVEALTKLQNVVKLIPQLCLSTQEPI